MFWWNHLSEWIIVEEIETRTNEENPISYTEVSKQRANQLANSNLFKPKLGQAVNFDPTKMDPTKVDWSSFVDKMEEKPPLHRIWR